MRTRLAPAPVCFFSLLAKAERYAELFAGECVDPPQYTLDECGFALSGQLAGLQHEAAVTRLEGPFRRANDFIRVHAVSPHLRIAAPYAAIVAVLLANVAELHKPAKSHPPSGSPGLYVVCRLEKRIRIGPGDKPGQFPMRQRARIRGGFLQQVCHVYSNSQVER